MLHNSKGMGVGSGEGKDNKMMLIGLGAVIVIAVGALVYSMVSGGDSSVAKAPEETMYQCNKCKAEWPIGKNDPMDPTKYVAGGLYFPDCPKCGAKLAGRAESPCPLCKAWYLTPKQGQGGHDVCPKCDGDVTQYWTEWARKHQSS